jgi:DNA invertase Pin-like site-specific DNA recombinase
VTCSAPGRVPAHWPSHSSTPLLIFAEIIFAILGVAAKVERRRILERTARGRADAKANVKFGRKPTLTPHQQSEARKRLEAGETQRSVARSYNVSQSTISRLTA